MTWLKKSWAGISAAFLAALAVFAAIAAAQRKAEARKWQEVAVDIEAGNVKKGTMTAEAASTQAKLHEAKAAEIKQKAEDRIKQIGDKHETMADLLDAFRR